MRSHVNLITSPLLVLFFALLSTLSLLALPQSAFAKAVVTPEIVPKDLPADVKKKFEDERKFLINEKKSIDAKVSRYNSRCGKPKPHLEHQCNTSRLALFQSLDEHKLKVVDFNKRLKTASTPPAKPVEEEAVPAEE